MDVRLMGNRIRMARQFRGLSIDDLADAIDMEPASLGHIERGERKTSLQTLCKISEILSVSLDYLAGLSSSPTETLLMEGLEEEALTPAQLKLLLEISKSLIPYVKRLS